MNYLFRFSVTFLIITANAENVISALKKIFSLYVKSKEIYCDREQHFENFKIKSFFAELDISVTFNSFVAHQNIGMIEIENRFLKNIFRKTKFTNRNWKKILLRTIHSLNDRIIFHLESFSFIILLKIVSETSLIDPILRFLNVQSVTFWAIPMCDSKRHRKAILEFLNFRNQLHDAIKTRFDH